MESGRKYWFAMRATFNRNVQARDALADKQIESFIPMHAVRKRLAGRSKIVLEPAIRNIIFVHAEPQDVQEAKSRLPYLQYMISRIDGSKIVVPDAQMDDFIAVCGTCDERLRFYADGELNLTLGQRVRITAGEFAGVEGTLMRIQGARDKRVVVSVDGIMSVSLMSLPPSQVEPLS